MQFFTSAIDTLQTLVVALGAGLGVWGVVNLLEGYGSILRNFIITVFCLLHSSFISYLPKASTNELAALITFLFRE